MPLFSKPRQVEVLHQWHALVENFNTSTQEFYASVERELKERQIPGLATCRVEFAEGGLLSAKREYLRLTRERLVFDICAAPFGTGFFFSSRYAEIPLAASLVDLLVLAVASYMAWALLRSWLGLAWGLAALLLLILAAVWLLRSAATLGQGDIDAALLRTPVLGPVYEKLFRKESYYREDTRLMYLETVPAVVKAVAEEVVAAKGLKLLNQHESSAILGELHRPMAPSPPPGP